jgi:hypothetical protein
MKNEFGRWGRGLVLAGSLTALAACVGGVSGEAKPTTSTATDPANIDNGNVSVIDCRKTDSDEKTVGIRGIGEVHLQATKRNGQIISVLASNESYSTRIEIKPEGTRMENSQISQDVNRILIPGVEYQVTQLQNVDDMHLINILAACQKLN